ncbi:NXPE family member 3-like [Patiria miniata]|uniref:NXPE C-terminal domain-containing protein n=1 Tax=Patiria miniata TaxID=46514 RepID=A0A914A5N8_PATMI|nr:NXPE family member 3-like [Patiria miniata]
MVKRVKNINGSKSFGGSTGPCVGNSNRRSWLVLAMLVDGLVLYLLLYFGSNNVQWNQPKPALRRYYSDSASRVVPSRPTQQGISATSKVLLNTVTPQVNPTIADNSFFYIQNPKTIYNICDQLELYIEARDGQGKRKIRGGDHMWPVLWTASLNASAPADELIDHSNGTYTAHFTLHWTGEIEPLVPFIYSAEHADFLRSFRERFPHRHAYDGKFTDHNGTVEITPCHVDRDIFVDNGAEGLSLASKYEVCDFSNGKAGTSWYCLKPKTLSCSDFTQHRGNTRRGGEYRKSVIRPDESSLVKRPKELKNIGKLKKITVISNVSDAACFDLPPCKSGLPPKQPNRAAGYYFEDSWKSKLCRERELNLSDTLKCLRNKRLYFYGDSTLRQWFLYLISNLGETMKEDQINTTALAKMGPRRARDPTHNITLLFRHHEYPIRNIWANVRDIKFTVNEIDGLPGGADTVVALTMWAHFTTNNLTYYQSRLERVRDAIARLHKRGTGTSPVFFKSANTRGYYTMDLSDLYAYDLDQTLRAVFKGVPDVTIIDVWDMTLSHRTGYHIHPVQEVIKEEIKMFLNFICNAPSVS